MDKDAMRAFLQEMGMEAEEIEVTLSPMGEDDRFEEKLSMWDHVGFAAVTLMAGLGALVTVDFVFDAVRLVLGV